MTEEPSGDAVQNVIVKFGNTCYTIVILYR